MDVQLGYDDGVLDTYDMYAKVRGNLSFGVSEEDWNTANGGPWRWQWSWRNGHYAGRVRYP